MQPKDHIQETPRFNDSHNQKNNEFLETKYNNFNINSNNKEEFNFTL